MTDSSLSNGVPPASCPACAGTEVRVALQGPAYPIYWCERCSSYFCRPPARAPEIRTAGPAVATVAPEAAADPEERTGWVRTFGDIRVELHRHDTRWTITICDGNDRCLLCTPAEGVLAEVQAKAERLVGYLPSTPWIPDIRETQPIS